MSEKLFYATLLILAAGFTMFFAMTIIPPLLESRDVFGAFAAGFVNPYAAGYSTDVILCWCVLAVWVAQERAQGVRHGWVCLLLGVVPGVVVGLALYLVLRARQRPALSS